MAKCGHCTAEIDRMCVWVNIVKSLDEHMHSGEKCMWRMQFYRAIFTKLVGVKEDRFLAVQPSLAVQDALRLQTRVIAMVIPAVHKIQLSCARVDLELEPGTNNHKLRTGWLVTGQSQASLGHCIQPESYVKQ